VTEAENPSTPNPLKRRDPALAKSLAAFRSRLGDMLLDKLAPLLDDPAFRSREGQELGDLRAVAQVLRVLAKANWARQDLETFDTYWRDASRSGLLADEFEADRHRIQHSIQTARKQLFKTADAKPLSMRQPTLW
jgi:hypothetical protein